MQKVLQMSKCTNIYSSSEKCLLPCCTTKRWHILSRSLYTSIKYSLHRKKLPIQVQEPTCNGSSTNIRALGRFYPGQKEALKHLQFISEWSLARPQAPCSAESSNSTDAAAKIRDPNGCAQGQALPWDKGSSEGDWEGQLEVQTFPRACLAPAAGTGCSVPQGCSGRDAVTCEDEDAAGLGV